MLGKISCAFIALITFSFSSVSAAIPNDTLPKKKDDAVIKPLKIKLNDDGSNFFQFTGLVQTWVRFNQSNPGTTVNGHREASTFDIGMRRVRFQMIGQLSDRVFIYSQVGMNSFSYLSERKFGFFVHDALGEYAFVPKYLSIGAGLGSWVGPVRFSSPGVASIMGYDAPIYQQTTNDLNDQFVRKMMVYAKGKIGKLDYRVSIAKPLIVNYSSFIPIPGSQAGIPVLGSLGNNMSTFSTRAPQPQFNSYLSYQFFDQEANLLPYNTGTYLGSKKVLNIGGGIQYQKNAMWYKEENSVTGNIDTISTQLLTTGVDVFFDTPLNKEKGTALSLYGAWMYSDYGPNYIRNFAPMNPADGNSTVTGTYTSGGGTAFPINGTGNTFYAQAGYKFKNRLLGDYGTLMPYAMSQVSKFTRFDEYMVTYDVGVNWLLKGHNSKISVDYNNRPFFTQALATDPIKQNTRRGCVIVQYQVSF